MTEKIPYIPATTFAAALSETFGFPVSTASLYLRTLREAGLILQQGKQRKLSRIGIEDAATTILAVMASPTASGAAEAYDGLHDRNPTMIQLIEPDQQTGDEYYAKKKITHIADVFDDLHKFREFAATYGLKNVIKSSFLRDFSAVLKYWHNDAEGFRLPSVSVSMLPAYQSETVLELPLRDQRGHLRITYHTAPSEQSFCRTAILTSDALARLLRDFHGNEKTAEEIDLQPQGSDKKTRSKSARVRKQSELNLGISSL